MYLPPARPPPLMLHSAGSPGNASASPPRASRRTAAPVRAPIAHRRWSPTVCATRAAYVAAHRRSRSCAATLHVDLGVQRLGQVVRRRGRDRLRAQVPHGPAEPVALGAVHVVPLAQRGVEVRRRRGGGPAAQRAVDVERGVLPGERGLERVEGGHGPPAGRRGGRRPRRSCWPAAGRRTPLPACTDQAASRRWSLASSSRTRASALVAAPVDAPVRAPRRTVGTGIVERLGMGLGAEPPAGASRRAGGGSASRTVSHQGQRLRGRLAGLVQQQQVGVRPRPPRVPRRWASGSVGSARARVEVAAGQRPRPPGRPPGLPAGREQRGRSRARGDPIPGPDGPGSSRYRGRRQQHTGGR